MKNAIVAAAVGLIAIGVFALWNDSSATEPSPRAVAKAAKVAKVPRVARVPKVPKVPAPKRIAPAPVAVAAPRAPTAIALPEEDYRQAREELAEGRAVLLDVREQRTWDDGYIAGAVSFPWSWLREYDSPDKLNTIPTDKIVYVYGDASDDAKLAANLLSDLGFDARPFEHSFTELAGRFRAGH